MKKRQQGMSRVAAWLLLALIALLSALVFVAPTKAAEDGWNLRFSGYSQERYDSTTGEVSNDRTRLRLVLENEKKSCGFFTELDISGLEDGSDRLMESNWLHRIYGFCEAGKTKVSFGRLFVRTGYTTYWPGGIITARYPGPYPWQGFYAYGVDVNRRVGGWEFAGMLSGASDLQFDDPGQFNRVEFAGRIKRSFGNLGHYSFGVQISDEFVHSGWEFRRNVNDVSFSGGVFYSDSDSTPFSALGQVEWKMSQLIALHGQVEEQADGDEVVTAGVGIRWRGFYFVGDYEYNFDSADPEALLLAVRYNW